MNFIKKNIKKILNKKNRKFLIVAIALIAAIAFYFYFNKENFGVKKVNEITRLSKKKRNEIQLVLHSIWKSTPKGTGNEKRGILQKCRSLLKKDKMTYDDIEYVQNSLSQLSNSPRIKKLMNKFDKVELIFKSAANQRKKIRDDLRAVWDASYADKKAKVAFIRDKMGDWVNLGRGMGRGLRHDAEITLEDHKEIYKRLTWLSNNNNDRSKMGMYEEHKRTVKDSLEKLKAKLEEAELE